MLETGLENLRLGLIPPGLDQVFVGSLDRSRHSEVRANFILGVNDGVLPARPAGDGMLTNHEREQLAVRGLKLAPDAKRSLFDEQYLIYLGLTRATEHLGISYALADQQGNALNPSLLIKELQEILPGIKVQEAPLEPNGHAADLDFMVSPRRALTYLTLKLREAKAGIPLNDGWRDVYNALIPASGQPSAGQLSAGCPSPGELSAECFLTEQSPAGEPSAEQTLFECPPKGLTDVLPGLKSGTDCGFAGWFILPKPGRLLQPKTQQKLYGTKLRAGVTQIEQFQACPFAHFLKYGLRLKERETWQLKPLDLGRFFHAALKIFVERVEQGQVKDQKLISQRQIQDQGLIGQDQDRVPVQEQNKIQGPDHGPKPESIWSQISEETCNRLVQKIIEELLPVQMSLLSSKQAQYRPETAGGAAFRLGDRQQRPCGSFRRWVWKSALAFPGTAGLQIPLGDIDVSVLQESASRRALKWWPY